MAHCAFIRRLASIWRRGLLLQRPDIPHRKHQNPSEGVEDAIDREFNDLFDQWRKLTREILPEPTERYEIGESVLLRKAIPHPAQINSVKRIYRRLKSDYLRRDRIAKTETSEMRIAGSGLLCQFPRCSRMTVHHHFIILLYGQISSLNGTWRLRK